MDWKLRTGLGAVASVALLVASATLPASAQSAPPGRPSGLVAISVAHDSVAIGWDDPGDGMIIGYRILRRDRDINLPGVFATLEEDTGSSAVSYVDETVEAERRYVYRVIAVSASSQSPRSTYLNVDTPAPPDASESEPEYIVELSEPEVPESEDGATQPEARRVWSATLDAGLDASKFPPEVGYSPSAGGELSVDTFTLGDTEHRVELLASTAGGLYFGLSAELQTEFTLHVGEQSFESSASSTATVAPAVDVYWWDNSDLEWSGSETLDVALDVVEGSSASSTERPSAPLSAYFGLVPGDHSGEDEFTFRIYFVNDVPAISYKTVRDHSLEVDGGTVRKARRVVRGSSRNWDITVMPDGDRDVSIALPAQRACGSHGAVCTSAEGRLHNRPHAVVTLRPTEVPPPPTNLRAKALNDGTVVLTWDAPDDDSITGYLVGRRRHHQSEWVHSTMEIVSATRSTATTVTQRSAVHDVLHAFYVKAVNAAGASERSNYDNATPFVGEFWEVGFHLPIVHLTFDDGPDPRFTPQILDLLAEYGARATFFVNGTRAALNPELIARITAEGHSVGNHAWQHESLPGLAREDFNSTLTRAQDLLGERGVRCLRPPYGHIDPVTRGWASSLGLKVVKWNVNSGDSGGAKAAKMVSKLSANVGYFDVVLMHDTSERTVEAVRILLGRWAQQGYEFKPVCEPSATAARPLNAVATGPPTVSGLAQVGQSLVADASAVTDGDGLEGVEFSYQWLADDAEIADAVHTSYTATADQEGRSITLQVSFVDNEGNHESLTSVPTAPLAEAEPASGTPQAPQNLVAEATQTEGELAVTWDPPSSDDRSAVTGYRVEWKLSADHWGGAEVSVIHTDETSHTISGLTQASLYAVRVRALNQPGAGAATGDVLASPTGAAPLLAEFADIPASRAGSDPFTVRVAFSEDVANGYIQMRDRAVEVTGGMVLTASRVERRNDLWEITILPHSTDHVTVVVATPTDCSTWGHICTASGKKLSNRLQLTVPGS